MNRIPFYFVDSTAREADRLYSMGVISFDELKEVLKARVAL